jgi:hypothetical protein
MTSPKAILRGAFAAAVLVGTTLAARAADIPSPRQEPAAPVPLAPALTFKGAAYLWATGLEGRMRTLPPLPTVKVDIGFDQVMKNFDGGIMGAGEIGYGRYLLFFDVIASKISPNKTVYPAGVPAGVKVDSASFIGLAAVGYRFVDTDRYSLDGFAGVRGFSTRNTLRVQLLPGTLKLSESEQWADAVIGARFRLNLTPSWYLTTIGFVGKGASRYEWDVFGGVGYVIDERWSAFAGYRAMKVDYRNGNFIFDALQQGPVLGLTSRF